jgi:hypothetical protein
MDRYFFFPLLCIYVTVVQFGSLGRYSDVESSYGLSTVIVVILVLFGVRRLVWAAIGERIFWVMGLLLVYLVIPSMLYREAINSLLMLFQVTCYIALTAVVSRTFLARSQIFTLWVFIAVGLFVSAALTIIDFAGIVDVPYNNNLWLTTKVGVNRVEQASGFFMRRSGMAAIFSIGIAGSLVFALAHASPMARLFFLAAGSTGLLCVFLTHNRSGVLGPLAIVSVYALLSPRFRGFRKIGMLMASIVIGMCFLLFIARYYPEHAAIYIAKLGFLGLSETTWESDHLRIDLFVAAMRSMGSNPLGNGFSLIELPGGIWMDPHNVVTAIIWAAGVFSLIWLPIFAATVFSYFSGSLIRRGPVRIPTSVEHDAVVCGLFTWLANGMTHNTLQTGLAWLFFGVLISDRYFSARSVPNSRTAVPTSQASFKSDDGISGYVPPATRSG